MRGKRAKQYRKLMHQYALAFGFRDPYQVLLDADIIKDAARYRMRLGAMLATTLHGPIKPMITQCCIRHLYDDDTTAASTAEKQAWITVAKAAERRRCGHHELARPLSARDCLASVVDPKGSGANRHRYVVASQDAEVRRAMRAVAGVPLVYIARSVMILEPMARRTEAVKEREEKGKIRAGLIGRRGAAKDQDDDGDDDDDAVGEKRKRVAEDGDTLATEAPRKKKVRGIKGPNPLSMMKKAKKDKDQSSKTPKVLDGERITGERVVKLDVTENGIDAEETAGLQDSGDVVEGERKRKRKRKPKDATGAVEIEDVSAGEGEG